MQVVMDFSDLLRLLHPAIAVTSVMPLIGIVAYYAFLTRQRRLQTADHGKTRIPVGVGGEHNKLGRWLTGAVVGLALLGLARPISKPILANQLWVSRPLQVGFILLMFALTISALVLLYRARSRLWRGTFATLTGMGLIILGCQDGVFRRTNEWFISHYYIGMTAAMLMIFALAIAPEIYQDRSQRWRLVHAVLNSLALLLFIGQGLTGTRDLLEIPLSWQEPYIYQCDFQNKTCPTPAPPPQSMMNERRSGVS